MTPVISTLFSSLIDEFCWQNSRPKKRAESAGMYRLKVKNRDTSVFIVDFEHNSHLVLVFLLLTSNIAGWEVMFPSGTIVEGSQYYKLLTRREYDLNLLRTWVQTLPNAIVQQL